MLIIGGDVQQLHVDVALDFAINAEVLNVHMLNVWNKWKNKDSNKWKNKNKNKSDKINIIIYHTVLFT